MGTTLFRSSYPRYIAEGRKKSTSVYCGLCTILSHIKTDRHPSRHSFCMGVKYQWFQRHVANCYVNQMKNDNTLTQRIVSNQPRLTTVAVPQTIYFRMIKWKCRAKIEVQAHIQLLSLPVAVVVIENGKKKQLRGLWKFNSTF